MPLTQAGAIIVDRRTTGPAVEVVLRVPEIAHLLAPGQPVLLKAGPALSPYLRRTVYPIAIDAEHLTLRVEPSTDWGDAWLRVAPVGAELDCLGPVGHGFTVESGVRNLLCVGEGSHSWTLLPLIGWADAAGLSVTFVVGAQSTRWALQPARLPAGVEYHLVTSDGRLDVLRPLMSTLSDLLPWADALCAALSGAAYNTLADTIRTARFALSPGFAEALYPAQFLCGTGACQACVADVAGGRRRVCLRGPVFDLVDLVARERA
jgi:dihydroorotate dehydrogenase electron transfer subunit